MDDMKKVDSFTSYFVSVFSVKENYFQAKNDTKWNYHYLEATDVKDSWRDHFKPIKLQQQITSTLWSKWFFFSFSVEFKF